MSELSTEFAQLGSFVPVEMVVPIILLLIVWSLAWKGMALWRSAQLGHKKWFIVFLIFQTAGILEIIYLARMKNEVRGSSVSNTK